MRASLTIVLPLVLAGVACSSTNEESSSRPAPVGPGAWTVGAPLPVDRFEAYGVVANGRLHFVGGITGVFGDMSTAQPSRRVDVFDPSTNAWTSGPELPEDAPKHHLTVASWMDRIYVLGGFDGILDQRPGEPFRPIAVAYVLDRDATSWRKLAPPPLARGGATAQAIDGKIYVTGGAPTEGQPSYDELDVYDIDADRWSTATRMPTAREHLASCAIGGKMIVVGGWAGTARVASNAAELYDPAADTWRVLAPMPTPRGGLGAAARGSSCHVVGGEDWALPFPGTFAAHEVLDVDANVWTTRAAMPTARHGLGLAWLGDRLYAVGGGPSQGNSYTSVVEIFAP